MCIAFGRTQVGHGRHWSTWCAGLRGPGQGLVRAWSPDEQARAKGPVSQAFLHAAGVVGFLFAPFLFSLYISFTTTLLFFWVKSIEEQAHQARPVQKALSPRRFCAGLVRKGASPTKPTKPAQLPSVVGIA